MLKLPWMFRLLLLTANVNCTSQLSKKVYRSVAYYTNWSVYTRNFTPVELPAENLTHILYAFADIKPETGEVFLTDPYADLEKNFSGELFNKPDNDLRGCFQQLYILKQKYRHLKVLLSIGGWTYSSNFALPAATAEGRATFAASAVALVANLGLDGLDLDWEYPSDSIEAQNFVLLLEAVRTALDTYGNSTTPSYHFELTVAAPAGSLYYHKLYISNMDRYIDFWNLMAFDYSGTWSIFTAHHTNLFPSLSMANSTPYNTLQVVSYYIAQGVASDKIVLGIPLYGRGFQQTNGLGQRFDGVGSGTWEAGIYDLNTLPLKGAIVQWDNVTAATYSYDSSLRELISFDDTIVVVRKALWIQEQSLGGVMWWESSADRKGTSSHIRHVASSLGNLLASPNQLSFPNSSYSNILKGMPELAHPQTPTSILPVCVYDPPESTTYPILSQSSSLSTLGCSMSKGRNATRFINSTLVSPTKHYSRITISGGNLRITPISPTISRLKTITIQPPTASTTTTTTTTTRNSLKEIESSTSSTESSFNEIGFEVGNPKHIL